MKKAYIDSKKGNQSFCSSKYFILFGVILSYTEYTNAHTDPDTCAHTYENVENQTVQT